MTMYINILNKAFFRLVAIVILFLPIFAFAQESITAPTTEGGQAVTPAESFVVANINLSDALILDQDKDNLTLTFALTNQGESPQFDINYTFEVVKTLPEGGQSVVDNFTASESIALLAGEAVTKSATYPITNIGPGTYSVWIIAQTSGGVILGLGNAGEFTIYTAEALEIVAESCSFSIPSDSATTTYTLLQGVDVTAAEDLTLNCMVINHGKNNKMVFPQFETFRRTTSGDKVDFSYPTPASIEVAAGAEQMVALGIPKPIEPQAYSLSVVMVDKLTNTVVSNNLKAHYVLSGFSATIQNINFDKTEYTAGEEMSLDLFWTPAADSFEGSRLGGTATVGEIRANISIVDGDGKICVPSFITTLTSSKQNIKAMSGTNCDTPEATVSLVGINGQTLDTRVITVPVSVEGNTQKEGTIYIEDTDMMILTIIFLVLSLMTILLVATRHKKVNIAQASKLLIITAMAVSGMFISGVEKVEAVSWSTTYMGLEYLTNLDPGTPIIVNRINFTVNANRTTYAPGQTIALSGTARLNTCSNTSDTYTLTASLGGQSIFMANNSMIRGGLTVYTMGNLVAPSTPGFHTINLYAEDYYYYMVRDCRGGGPCTETLKLGVLSSSATITIYVAGAPTVPIFNGASCILGIPAGQSTCQGVINWNIQNASNPNIYNLSRGVQYSTNPVGLSVSVTLGYGNNTVAARDGVNNLRTTNLTASCALGATWNGTMCVLSAVGPVKISCPFTTTPTRTVVDFTSGTALVSNGDLASSQSPAIPVSIPAGNYDVRLVTWDGGLNRASDVGQDKEKMMVSLLSSAAVVLGATNHTNDLVDGVNEDSVNQLVNSNWDIPTGVSSVRAENQAYPDISSSNSFFPICAVFERIAPTGSVSANSCSIPNLSNTCNGNVTWNITGATNPRITVNGLLYSANDSGNQQSATLNYGINTVAIWDDLTSLDLANVVTDCAVGTWNALSNMCDSTNSQPVTPPPPIINLTTSKSIVRSGETANVGIKVTAPYPTSCIVSGVENSPLSFVHLGDPSAPTSPIRTDTTRPLTSAQIVSVTCTPSPAIAGVASTTADARVKVVPIIIEI